MVVVVKGQQGRHRHLAVHVDANGHAQAALTVTVAERLHVVAMDWHFNAIRATGTHNGRPFTAQIERDGLWYRVEHNGTRIDAMVLLPRAAELMRLMPFKAPPDMSKFLLSPMPGLLVQLAVTPGQAVQAGERLAVIEAMKMENILVATQDGTVSELLARQGESLAVDQAIMSFV
jgi:propionyl-CoA carboxylase alpha chain